MLHTVLPAEPAVAFMSSAVLTKDRPSWVCRVYIPSQKEVAERVTGLSLEDSDIPPNQLCVILPSLYTTSGSQGGLKYLGWEELGKGLHSPNQGEPSFTLGADLARLPKSDQGTALSPHS